MIFTYEMFPDFNYPEKCNTLVVRLFSEDGKTIENCYIFRLKNEKEEFKACSKYYGDNPLRERVDTIEEARLQMEKIWAANHQQITYAFDSAGQNHGSGPWTSRPFQPDYGKVFAMQHRG